MTTAKTDILAAVALAGETLGYWTTYIRKGFEDHTGRIDVRDAAGREFYLRCGGQNDRNKIIVDTVSLEDRTAGLNVYVFECRAGISDSKAPEIIAKDAFRRVVGKAEVIAGIEEARVELKRLQASRNEFRFMVDALRLQGWRTAQEREGEDWLPRGEVWSVRLYKPNVPAIELNRDGSWKFVYSPSFKLRDLDTVLGMEKA